MKEFFVDKTFNAKSLEIIRWVSEILEEYAAGGYTLTLRQVYYQLVARAYLPNSDKSYKLVGDVVSDARLAGLIDWALIEDRARETVIVPSWDSPGDILDACVAQYRSDRWEEQSRHVELLVEKQALEGILEPVARRWCVPFTSNKGYLSQSMMYQISKRCLSKIDDGKELVILYLGDHDPSGLDMDRDIESRLALFMHNAPFAFRRLALTREQIDLYNPPENPAKVTDSRAKYYIERHGDSSWELDALEPKMLEQLVSNAISSRIDKGPWEACLAAEDAARQQIAQLADQLR